MDTKVSLRRTRLPRHSVKCVICWWTSSFGRPLFFFSHWLFCPSVGISFFFFFLNLRYLKGYPHRLCRCSHNFFQQTWFPEENGIMKKFSLSTTLGHGWCQNQWFTLFPLPSKAINGQRSVRLRRYKTACCSRLSRPQAGIALVVPESALTFIWANLLPSIQVLPSFPACSLLKEEYPISFPMNLQKNEINLFLLNEFFRRRRVIQLPLWCSSIQQRSRLILSATPACTCADHLCAHTFEGQGSLYSCTVLYSDAVTASSGHGKRCGCWDDSITFYWKHAENVKKNKK